MQRLVSVVPELRRVLEGYWPNYNELPPDPLIGVLAIETSTRFDEGASEGAEQMQAVLGFFEAEYGMDADTDALIDGFLRPVTVGIDSSPSVVDLAGPKLRTRLGQLSAELSQQTYRPSSHTTAFVDRLLAAVPSLQDTVRQHISENNQLLPTVLLDDLTDRLVRSYAASIDAGTGMPVQVRAFLDFVESEFGGDTDIEVDNLIGVSFIENLPSPRERGAGIVHALGPKLRDWIARYQPDLLG